MRDTPQETAAVRLRRAGYVKLPGLWVTEAQMDAIKRMAEGNRDEVNRIRQADPYAGEQE